MSFLSMPTTVLSSLAAVGVQFVVEFFPPTIRSDGIASRVPVYLGNKVAVHARVLPAELYLSNSFLKNPKKSHATYIDITLAKRGSRVGKFCLVFYFDHPPPPVLLCQRVSLSPATCSTSITWESWLIGRVVGLLPRYCVIWFTCKAFGPSPWFMPRIF